MAPKPSDYDGEIIVGEVVNPSLVPQTTIEKFAEGDRESEDFQKLPKAAN